MKIRLKYNSKKIKQEEFDVIKLNQPVLLQVIDEDAIWISQPYDYIGEATNSFKRILKFNQIVVLPYTDLKKLMNEIEKRLVIEKC